MYRNADGELADALPDGVLRPVAPRYLEEPRGVFTGEAGLVAAPRDSAELAEILRQCHARHVPVVPRGGGTGLVGGAVMAGPVRPLIVSLERMTAVTRCDPSENIIEIGAGASLAAAQQEAERVNRRFGISLASEGTAQIGGVLATNAGGINVIRHGTARAQCLGLEAVTAEGRVLSGLSRLYKDNTGYDLRDLLIGSEGTLAIITAASLRLHPRPARNASAVIAVSDPSAALELLARCRDLVPDMIDAFELISGQSLAFLRETMPALRQPFADAPEWFVLIRLGTPAQIDPAEALLHLFAQAHAEGLASDGIVAQSEVQARDFWRLREEIPTANRAIGAISSHDISLPLSEISAFLAAAGAALERFGTLRVNVFGHLGDGNLHYNLFAPPSQNRADFLNLRKELQDTVHDVVMAHGGSFSAEHGVGRLKADDVARRIDPVRVELMRRIKASFDPHAILNPGAVLQA